jgi:hypothetical protein
MHQTTIVDPFIWPELKAEWRDGQFYLSQPFEADPMSTAIFRSFTSEGFVMAADGLRLTPGDPASRKEHVQKIFCISDATRTLAFALAGCVYTSTDNGYVFDFAAEVGRAAKMLAAENLPTLNRYTETVSEIVSAILRDAVSTKLLVEYPDDCAEGSAGELGRTIAYLFLLGYYTGRPEWTSARFWHENQVLQPPTVFAEPARHGLARASGSDRIFNLLRDRTDPRFFAYLTDTSNYNLAEAVKFGENYIRACSDPLAVEIDPRCATIGGRIHIATVKPESGFQWVAGFAP